MSFVVSKTQQSTFQPAPKGTFQAVCVDVVDQGMQANTFKDGKLEPKISLSFQIDRLNEEGNPYLISRWFTLSLHERASLSAFLCEWMDISYEEIPEDFDLEGLVGRNARLRIIQEPKKNKPDEIRATIKSIEPWDGDELLQPRNYTRVADRDNYSGPPATQPAPAGPVTTQNVQKNDPRLNNTGTNAKAAARAILAEPEEEPERDIFDGEDEAPPFNAQQQTLAGTAPKGRYKNTAHA